MKVAVASDHAGFALKEYLKGVLRAAGHEIEDFGTHNDSAVDFSDFAYPAALAVSEGRAARAILVDGAGYPSAIVANLLPGVFAAVANDTMSATFARTHSDTNVLCLGGKIIGEATAAEALRIWMDSAFLGGKYATRVEKLKTLARRHRAGPPAPPLSVLTVFDLRDAVLRGEPLNISKDTIVTPSMRDLISGG